MTAPPRQTMLATAPVSKLIWTFAIPAILSQVVNSMHNIVDQTFLGWGIGDLAIAATNIAFPLSTLTTALAALIGMGGAAGFSLDLGKKQARSARKNWGNAIVLSVELGCLLAVLAVALVGGGAAFYFKVLRPKQQKAAAPQEDYGDELTDYDEPDGYGDEDDDGPPWDEEDDDGEEADK